MKIVKLLTLTISICLSNIAQAALYDRGSGLIYDDTKNITWLKDANLAKTNSFGVEGIGNNSSYAGDIPENAIIPWLKAVNASNYLGFDKWRLPQADGCGGLNCTDSEMGNLFYNELGGKPWESIYDVHNSNFNLFSNIENFTYVATPIYYTSYEFDKSTGEFFHIANGADFDLKSGRQNGFSTFIAGSKAWLVIDGDVAAPVPEPQGYALMLIGLVLLGFNLRRKRPVGLHYT